MLEPGTVISGDKKSCHEPLKWRTSYGLPGSESNVTNLSRQVSTDEMEKEDQAMATFRRWLHLSTKTAKHTSAPEGPSTAEFAAFEGGTETL